MNFVRLLVQYYDETELRELMMELTINPARVGGDTLQETAVNLVAYCERHGLSARLIELCQAGRPFAAWPVM